MTFNFFFHLKVSRRVFNSLQLSSIICDASLLCCIKDIGDKSIKMVQEIKFDNFVWPSTKFLGLFDGFFVCKKKQLRNHFHFAVTYFEPYTVKMELNITLVANTMLNQGVNKPFPNVTANEKKLE